MVNHSSNEPCRVSPISVHRSKLIGLVFLWFLIGGIAQFAGTNAEIRIVPPYIPWPRFAVLVTGGAELLGALGLLCQLTRRAAGLGLFILTIAVTPAHIYMQDVGAAIAATSSATHPERVEH